MDLHQINEVRFIFGKYDIDMLKNIGEEGNAKNNCGIDEADFEDEAPLYGEGTRAPSSGSGCTSEATHRPRIACS